MPNWCENYAEIRHESEHELLSLFYEGKKGKFLSYWLPVPEEIWLRQPISNKTEEDIALKAKYGFDNWYDWSIANWGTKWDVDLNYDTPNLKKQGSLWELTVRFESAWAPPTTAYEAAEKKGFFITATYYEGGVGFCGLYETGEAENYIEISETEYEDIPEKIRDTVGVQCSYEEENDELEEDL